jgi:hypothetical protein
MRVDFGTSAAYGLCQLCKGIPTTGWSQLSAQVVKGDLAAAKQRNKSMGPQVTVAPVEFQFQRLILRPLS